jgi:hypothetical protein
MATQPVPSKRRLEYSHLMKPLLVQAPPEGLYSEPRAWMEGKDMEGFNAHFSYGFIKQPGPIHPKEGALVHPYDELLIFAGIETSDIRYLGAEVSVQLGEEREEHVFDKPSVILVPKGTQHGPVNVRKIDKPFVHYTIGLAPEYKATAIPAGVLPPVSRNTRHAHLVKPLLTDVSRNKTEVSGMGYTRSVDPTGVMYPVKNGMGPGNADQLVWLYGNNLEGMEVNFTWGFYSGCGKWHRGGEAHTHPEEEILIFVGLDPDNINYLGAELELGMGIYCERHIFNTPTVAVCPKGFAHLPLIVRWVDKPYGFIVINLSAEHDSPWVEASV